MKNIIVFTSIACLLFVSCNKENGSAPAVKERVSLKASVEDLTTKTDYTISGSTATFKWSGTEVFGRLVRATADGTTFTTYSAIDYTSTSELDSATGEFSGEEVGEGYADTELAIYPVNKTNGANVVFPTTGSDFKLTLNETLVYDAANTLKDIVPMIGKLDGGDYTFKPITGVLAIKATNIPSTATKITISSTGKGLSGTTNKITGLTSSDYKSSLQSLLYTSDSGIPLSWFSSAATKSYTFSGLSPANTYTFYFPLPTGTLPDLTITFYKGGTVLYTVTTDADITITRGKITPLKLISMPQYKVTVSGTATAPKANFYRENATVFFTVSSESELARDSYIAGMKFTHDPAYANDNFTQYPLGSAAGLTGSSGLRYLHYVIAPVTYKGGNCDAVPNEAIIAQGKILFYYLDATDAASFAKQYHFTKTDGTNFWHPGTGSNYTTTMTLAASDDITKGNLMISELYGMTGDNKRLYGVRNASDTGSITFSYNGDGSGQHFYYFNGNYFHIAQGASHDAAASSSNIVFTVTDGPTLTCASYLMMKYTTNYTSWGEHISGVGLVFN